MMTTGFIKKCRSKRATLDTQIVAIVLWLVCCKLAKINREAGPINLWRPLWGYVAKKASKIDSIRLGIIDDEWEPAWPALRLV